MKIILRAFLLNVALAALSFAHPVTAPLPTDAAQSKPVKRPAEWAAPIDTHFNLYRITPKLYRSAQPEQRDAALLQKLGIRTVISFRAHHNDKDVLNLPGVKLVSIPMDTWHIGDKQITSALNAIAQAQKDGPVLIHCQHGADRTGAVSAMYRIIEQGWTPRQAVRELKEGGYGFHEIWAQIPRYVEHANIEALRTQLAVGAVGAE